ncbi:MAG TPA: presqualene diphosphate synthase HpnD [Patescibacteria group bacterium]|jgi:phytoene synthase|nr:presqualene diphosphate synthase HpnD [Patescibacteria group bacterium]
MVSERARQEIIDQRFATRVTRASGSNFYYSFLFLPRAQREGIHAIYAFCRVVDDSVDSAGSALEAANRVAFWRGELAACYGGVPTHPIARSLASHLRSWPIRRQNLEEIIDGVAMDVTPRRYATFDELQGYCYRVASAVGLVCIEVFGYTRPEAREYASALGLAFQMTNILRDVRADALRGRIYLPTEETRRFGCPDEDLLAGRPTPAFVSMMRFQVERAKGLFAKAESLFPREDRSTLFAAEIMGSIYAAILEKIERRGYDVLREKVTLSKPGKLLIATRCYLRSRAPA